MDINHNWILDFIHQEPIASGSMNINININHNFYHY